MSAARDSKERMAAYRRAYAERNKERMPALKRAYYEKNKGRLYASQRANAEQNKERVAAYKRAYYERNRELEAVRSRDWAARNGERRAFSSHKAHSTERGIAFLFTFEEWWSVWQQSGHWHERGRRSDQYVMARFGDRGPYAVGNVKIVTAKANAAEWMACAEPLARISAAQTGRRRSPESIARQRATLEASRQQKFPEHQG
jgi:hypothetical protein